MSVAQHIAAAKDIVARFAVLTLSDTRKAKTDASGTAIRRLLEADGHSIAKHDLLPDAPTEPVAHWLAAALADGKIDAVITTGGTGVARRDLIIPLIDRVIDSPLPGFGELFRQLSYQEIGPAAMMSRATAGIASGKPLFALPGSTHAVELAVTKLILPQVRHVLFELRK